MKTLRKSCEKLRLTTHHMSKIPVQSVRRYDFSGLVFSLANHRGDLLLLLFIYIAKSVATHSKSAPILMNLRIHAHVQYISVDDCFTILRIDLLSSEHNKYIYVLCSHQNSIAKAVYLEIRSNLKLHIFKCMSWHMLNKRHLGICFNFRILEISVKLVQVDSL